MPCVHINIHVGAPLGLQNSLIRKQKVVNKNVNGLAVLHTTREWSQCQTDFLTISLLNCCSSGTAPAGIVQNSKWRESFS